MSDLTLALIALFASVALLAGTATSTVLARRAPSRRRLFGTDGPTAAEGVFVDVPQLTDTPSPTQQKLAALVPKSPREMGRLQKRLALAGFHGLTPALVYVAAEVVCALLAVTLAYFVVGLRSGGLFLIAAAIIGYMVPGYVVARRVRLRKKQIQNGLPDALDLLIVSLEAGLALDQAILKCSEELVIAYPALSHELQMINIETRAGKPRLEALKNFAQEQGG